MTPERPDKARKTVAPRLVGALRSRARRPLVSRRSLLIGCVAVGAFGAWGLASTRVGTATSGGAENQAVPSLASFHRHEGTVPSANAGTNSQFTIAGTASKVLYPGTRSSIDLAFTNTTGTAITLPAGAIAITINSPRPTTCPASPNFLVDHTLTATITIPPHVTGDSLSDMGVKTASWPVISMVTTHVTQDACQGMALSLRYAATMTTTTPVTGGTTGTGTGSQSGGTTPSGSSTVPVETATGANPGGGLAFTGFDVLLFAGSGALLLLAGTGLLTWRRRLGARR